MKYNVTINETLARTLQVEADSQKEAESAIHRLYHDSGIILSADDFVSTDIIVDKSQPYYKSPSNDFTLIQGDCNDTLSKFSFGFDMVFADPPYFLSSGGISYQSGKVVCVDKGDWDKTKTPQEMDAFNLRWLTSVRAHMKDNATIMDFGHLSQHLQRSAAVDTSWLQDPQRGDLGQDQSATQYLLPVFHLQHRVYHLGPKTCQSASLLQLRFDEATQRQQADDRRLASPCHSPVGEVVRQASHAKAPGTAGAHHRGEHEAGGLDS